MALAAALTVAFPARGADEPPATAQPVVRPDNTVTMNFVNADLLAVIKAVAEMNGRNVLIDPRVSGTVSIVTPRPVPRSLTWSILLSALRAQGFTAVPGDGGLMRIVPESDAKFFAGGTGGAAGDTIVTEVFVLQNERAAQLVPLLRPLMSPNNVVNAAPSANALIVTDYAENIARIRRVIAEVDRTSTGDIVAIPLKHAAAADFIQIVQRLVPEATATPGGAPGPSRVAIAMDPRTNSILVRADNPALAARIRGLVTTLDAPSTQPGNIHVVYLRNADATRLAEALRALLGQPTSAATSGANANGMNPNLPGGAMAGTQGLLGTGMQQQANQQVGMPGQQGANMPGQGTLASTATGQLATLPPIAAGSATPGGVTIQAYPEQNSLVIVAPDPMYNALRAVIDKLDARRAQIYVEALIVEVTSTRAAEFGIQWQDLSGLTKSGTQAIGATNFGLNGAPINGVTQGLPNLPQGLTLGVVRGTLTIAGKEIFNLQMLARALQTDSEANILSTPNLVTLDNEEARIIVGQNIPITTGSFALSGSGSGLVNPFQTFSRQDIGVGLRVRPQVAEAGAVKLGIYQEVSSIRDQTNPNGIIINKRALESQVVVDDGQIIVLGGLISDDVNSTVQSVPVLGQIPLIGGLFRYSTRQRDKTNLMVFLRPLVMRDSGAAERLTADRYDYIRDVQGAQRLPPSLVLPDMPTPQLPPREDAARSGAVRPGAQDLRNGAAPPAATAASPPPPERPAAAPSVDPFNRPPPP